MSIEKDLQENTKAINRLAESLNDILELSLVNMKSKGTIPLGRESDFEKKINNESKPEPVNPETESDKKILNLIDKDESKKQEDNAPQNFEKIKKDEKENIVKNIKSGLYTQEQVKKVTKEMGFIGYSAISNISQLNDFTAKLSEYNNVTF